MRRFLVAGNWKMNTNRATGEELAGALAANAGSDEAGVEVLVCPPFPYLTCIADKVSGSAVNVGSQDVYFEAGGAFTGEVAVDMIKDVGCKSVIIGHSERRHVLGETDEIINKKVKAGIAGGLQVVLCVGELLSDREAGNTESVLDAQMAGGLADISAADAKDLVIAYEPVWAIGTGKTASPAQAQEVHAMIRARLAKDNADVAAKVQILYGGSVKPDNAADLFSQADIDGGLIGGAALDAGSFVAICQAAAAG